jgi:hypothetical protein
MKIRFYFTCFFLIFLISCKEEKPKNSKPITLGDSTTIVTENDSAYLVNYTKDISPVKKQSSERQITQMMVQVDSLKASQKLENTGNKMPEKIQGFTINFNECSVILNGMIAHALNNTQDERKLNSVSYLKDGGQFLDTKIQIDGLTEVRIEQRIFTKLFVEQNNETYELNDLGKFTSQWFNLAGKDNQFVSTSSNSIGFNSVDHAKIKNALDRELRKKKLDRKQIEAWMKLIDKTQSYTDAPCVVKIVSSQWRIFGVKNGKKVQKLIQFDEKGM